jgi:BirA family biotin operon repressor/biotin-[acetyl-CoA-carboxylase] ligase
MGFTINENIIRLLKEKAGANGYRLAKSPDLSVEEIKNNLQKTIFRKIIYFKHIDSTNTVAMELAEKGFQEGDVLIADKQTQGKGRLGRKWLSPAGKNLYMSIILKPHILPADAAFLTLMSAVACASALRSLTSVPVSIKWPNDLMASDKKLGGILTEIKANMDRIIHAVIGIGININLDAEDMPDDIKDIATSIKIEQGSPKNRRFFGAEKSSDFSRTLIAVEILKELDRWYNILLNKGKNTIKNEWLKLSSTINRSVKVTVMDAIFKGTARGIDDNGMLILQLSDNSLKKISAGDVTHLFL